MSVERKYALVRLGKSDYLLPSNDGQTLWRIYTYTEDGSGYWIINDNEGREREVQIKGTFWACSRWDSGMPDLDATSDLDLREWEHWDHWSATLRTRKQAIEEALQAE